MSSMLKYNIIFASILSWSTNIGASLTVSENAYTTLLELGKVWYDDTTVINGNGWSLNDISDSFYHGFWNVDELSDGPHMEKEFYLPKPTMGVSIDGNNNDEHYNLYLRINFTYTVACSFNTHSSLLWYAFSVNNERLSFDEFTSFDVSSNENIEDISIKSDFPYVNELCFDKNESESGFILDSNNGVIDNEDVWVNLTYSRVFKLDSDDLEISKFKNGNLNENDEYDPESPYDILRIVFGSVTKEESRSIWGFHSFSIEVDELVYVQHAYMNGNNSNETQKTVELIIRQQDTVVSSHVSQTVDFKHFVKDTVNDLLNKPWWEIGLVILGIIALLFGLVFGIYLISKRFCCKNNHYHKEQISNLSFGSGIEGIEGIGIDSSNTIISSTITTSNFITDNFPFRKNKNKYKQRRKSVFDGIDASVIAPDRDNYLPNGKPPFNNYSSNNFINSIIFSSDNVRGAWRRDVPEFEDGFDSDNDQSVSPGVTYSSAVAEHKQQMAKKKKLSKFPMFKPSKLVAGVRSKSSKSSNDNNNNNNNNDAGGSGNNGNTRITINNVYGHSKNGSSSVRSVSSKGSNAGSGSGGSNQSSGNAGGNHSGSLNHLRSKSSSSTISDASKDDGTLPRANSFSEDSQNAEEIMGMINLANDVVQVQNDSNLERPASVLHRKSPSEMDNLMASLDALESKSRAKMSAVNSRAQTPRTWKSIFSDFTIGGTKQKKPVHERNGFNVSGSSTVSAISAVSVESSTPTMHANPNVAAAIAAAKLNNNNNDDMNNDSKNNKPHSHTHTGSVTYTPDAIDSNFDIPDNASELSDIDYQGLFLQDIVKQAIENDVNHLNRLSEMNEDDNESNSSQLTGLEEGSNVCPNDAIIVETSSNENELNDSQNSININISNDNDNSNGNDIINDNKSDDSDSGLFEWKNEINNNGNNGNNDKEAKMRAKRVRALRAKRKKAKENKDKGDSPDREGSATVAVSVSVSGVVIDTEIPDNNENMIESIDSSLANHNNYNNNNNKGSHGRSRFLGITENSKSHNLSDFIQSANIVYGDSDHSNSDSNSKSTTADCIDTSLSDNERGTNKMMDHVLLDDFIANCGNISSGDGMSAVEKNKNKNKNKKKDKKHKYENNGNGKSNNTIDENIIMDSNDNDSENNNVESKNVKKSKIGKGIRMFKNKIKKSGKNKKKNKGRNNKKNNNKLQIGTGARSSCGNESSESDFDIGATENTNIKKQSSSNKNNFKFALQTSPELKKGSKQTDDESSDDGGTTIVLSGYDNYHIEENKSKPESKPAPFLPTLSEL